MNNPACAHLLKYLWTLLAALHSFGNAFHWMPVRNTKKIAASTCRGGSGFLPPAWFPLIGSSLFPDKLLINEYNITYINFADELLMSSPGRIEELCNTFMDSGLKFQWSCNGRLNFAKADVLSLMKKAGCNFINYGIESVDDIALKNMNKSLTVAQIIEGIENTLAQNISPGLNIIFGNIGENHDVLRKDVDFLLKYDDHTQLRTIRPVTPYPGSPLYYYAIEKGLLDGGGV